MQRNIRLGQIEYCSRLLAYTKQRNTLHLANEEPILTNRREEKDECSPTEDIEHK